jgi:hypothetical protein
VRRLEETRRTPFKWIAMAVTVLITVVWAAALVLGPAALAIWSYAREGATGWTVMWVVIAVAWTALIVQAVVRSAETRGWIALGLFGWLAVVGRLLRGRRDPEG